MVTYIYMFYDGVDSIKVGVTSNLDKRLRAVQTGNPRKISLFYSEEFNCSKGRVFKIEKMIHKELGDSLKAKQGEWFECRKDQLELAKGVITWNRIRYENDDLYFKYGKLFVKPII